MVLTGSSDSPKVRHSETLRLLDICKPGYVLPSQVVHERLICRTMVDGHSSYEHVHSVDVACSFRSSLLSIFPEKVNFYMEKVGKNGRRQRCRTCCSELSFEMSCFSIASSLSRSWART